MNFALVCLAVVAVCFQSISALSLESLPGQLQEKIGKDEKECVKKMIDIMSTVESVDLGDFHGKSEMEKVKALWEEMRHVFRHGNNFTKHFEEAIAENYDKKDGSVIQKELEEFMETSAKEMQEGDDKITSCTLSAIFQAMLDLVKKSSETGRIGDIKKFMAMAKDMMASVDLDKKNFMDSPAALFAYGSILLGAVPDFVLSAVTVLVYIPEQVLERFVDEFPKALESFGEHADEYMKIMKDNFGNFLEDSSEEKVGMAH